MSCMGSMYVSLLTASLGFHLWEQDPNVSYGPIVCFVRGSVCCFAFRLKGLCTYNVLWDAGGGVSVQRNAGIGEKHMNGKDTLEKVGFAYRVKSIRGVLG